MGRVYPEAPRGSQNAGNGRQAAPRAPGPRQRLDRAAPGRGDRRAQRPRRDGRGAGSRPRAARGPGRDPPHQLRRGPRLGGVAAAAAGALHDGGPLRLPPGDHERGQPREELRRGRRHRHLPGALLLRPLRQGGGPRPGRGRDAPRRRPHGPALPLRRAGLRQRPRRRRRELLRLLRRSSGSDAAEHPGHHAGGGPRGLRGRRRRSARGHALADPCRGPAPPPRLGRGPGGPGAPAPAACPAPALDAPAPRPPAR